MKALKRKNIKAELEEKHPHGRLNKTITESLSSQCPIWFSKLGRRITLKNKSTRIKEEKLFYYSKDYSEVVLCKTLCTREKKKDSH